MNRIASLDGLRAISIAMVMLGHLSGTRGFPTLESRLDYANLGVRIFFIISGFLITGLLQAEKREQGVISLKRFYWRRTIRIFPAYYSYLLVVWCLMLLGISRVTLQDLLHAATYTTNYHTARSWDLGHAWSLGVEEQFYLVWPALVAFLSPSGSIKACATWLLVVPCARVLMMALPNGVTDLQMNVGFSFETVSDSIATGCLLALLQDRLSSCSRYVHFLSSKLFALVPVLGLIAFSLDRWNDVVPRQIDFLLTAAHALVGITGANIAVAICIDWCIRKNDTLVWRMLNHQYFARVGVLSYSLYLWQQPFLNRNSTAWYSAFPQNLVFSILAAVVCHELIEKPALRLRQRFLRNSPVNMPRG